MRHHYDEYGFQPIVVFDGDGRFITAVLRPAKRPKGTEIRAFLRRLTRALRANWPQTKILLLGVFPRGEKTDPVREQVKAVNAGLARLDDGGKIKFLDLGEKFLAPDGTLSRDLFPDLLHPNAKGYQIWADAMEPTLSEMLK